LLDVEALIEFLGRRAVEDLALDASDVE